MGKGFRVFRASVFGFGRVRRGDGDFGAAVGFAVGRYESSRSWGGRVL